MSEGGGDVHDAERLKTMVIGGTVFTPMDEEGEILASRREAMHRGASKGGLKEGSEGVCPCCLRNVQRWTLVER